MRIFITGATGLIGIPLSLKLADSGHTVHALYRSEDKAKVLQHRNIRLFKGHIFDRESLRNAMESCDAVMHLAAYARVWAREKETFYRINVEGTTNILDLACELKLRRVVITSTVGVFGPSDNIPCIDESTIRESVFFNEYEKTKALADERSLAYLEKGLEVVIVHPTRVYGPGLMNESNSVTKLIAGYISGKWHFIPGNGKKSGNYVFIDDVVEGHIIALDKGKSGEQYIIGGEDIDYNGFFSLLGELSGRRYRLYHIPGFVMIGVSSLMVAFCRLFGGVPPITPGFARRYNHHWRCTSNKAVQELGYKITPLRVGIHKTLEWLNK